MKIGKVAAYVFAGLMTVSCNVKPPKSASQKAEQLAAGFLKGDEFLKIKDAAPLMMNGVNVASNLDVDNRIFYWDSILAYNKFINAIDSGRAYILDSIAGKPVKRPNFKINNSIDNRTPDVILRDTKYEVAKYYTASEMRDLQVHQPVIYSTFSGNERNYLTHYYGNVAIQAAEREGFERGAEAQRWSMGLK